MYRNCQMSFNYLKSSLSSCPCHHRKRMNAREHVNVTCTMEVKINLQKTEIYLTCCCCKFSLLLRACKIFCALSIIRSSEKREWGEAASSGRRKEEVVKHFTMSYMRANYREHKHSFFVSNWNRNDFYVFVSCFAWCMLAIHSHIIIIKCRNRCFCIKYIVYGKWKWQGVTRLLF